MRQRWQQSAEWRLCEFMNHGVWDMAILKARYIEELFKGRERDVEAFPCPVELQPDFKEERLALFDVNSLKERRL